MKSKTLPTLNENSNNFDTHKSTMKLIADYAVLIDRNKDLTLYQHASTLQLFQTINQIDGNVELFIFDSGWHSKGVMSIDKLITKFLTF